MQNQLSGISPSVQSDRQVAIDVGDDLNEEEQAFMPEFFAEVGQIKTQMSLIRKNIKTIQDIYDKQPWSIDNGQNQKISELEEILDSTNASSSQVRNKLKAMKAENDKLPAENAQKRIRTNMHAVLSKKFLVLLQEYQSIQNSYREKSRERFQRQAEIVQPGVTREQVDDMLATGGDYFGDKLLNDKKHSEAKNALLTIQEQQRDLKHLEKSIQDLHQVFMDMAILVESTSEAMEKVELNMSKTVESGTLAVQYVKEAEESTMQRRRKMTLLATGITTVVLIALVVVALIVAAKLGAFS